MHPEQFYQAGELSHVENTHDFGNSQSESEEQGYGLLQPPGPIDMSALSYSGDLSPGFGWGSYPFDYIFLTGQYPVGTLSHYSSNFEQGTDHYHDVHYANYYPLNGFSSFRYPVQFGGRGPMSGMYVQAPYNV